MEATILNSARERHNKQIKSKMNNIIIEYECKISGNE